VAANLEEALKTGKKLWLGMTGSTEGDCKSFQAQIDCVGCQMQIEAIHKSSHEVYRIHKAKIQKCGRDDHNVRSHDVAGILKIFSERRHMLFRGGWGLKIRDYSTAVPL